MRRLGFLFLLLTFPSIAALADSITIGELTYLGLNSQGVSQFQVQIDSTNGITAAPLTFLGLEGANGALEGISHTFNTAQTTEYYFSWTCPCTAFTFVLEFNDEGKLFTFLLANGKPFTAYDATFSTILPLSGQTSIRIGQSVPIRIAEVPEPGTALLLCGGLACISAKWKSRRSNNFRQSLG
jgi:hypothetical protein